MKRRFLETPALFGTLALIACQPASPRPSSEKIVHGRDEAGFPAVVPIQMDSRAFCTGTFISDAVLVTAAHCVDHARSVEWLGSRKKSSQIMIHSRWPTTTEACQAQPMDPRYDVALVQFPAHSFPGEPAKFLNRPLQVGETLTIVGYGNNKIIPYERYCTLPSQKLSDGQCHVLLGTRKEQTADYSYASVLAFEAGPAATGPGCASDCTLTGLKSSLEADQSTLKDFVQKNCDGQFRDRSYREEGVGVKRSGTNRIAGLDDGTIRFIGEVVSDGVGQDSVSGSGDSGGPLFIERDGQSWLAGITHGGRLLEQNGELSKLSIYANLTDDASSSWLHAINQEEQLNISGL